MKRIRDYKKLFNVEEAIDLKELKSTYRGLVKEWHPDKFQDEAQKEEAGIKSREIIEAYHFLVSIAPETIEEGKGEYALTLASSQIADFQHEGLLLEIAFTDGTTYEYFGVEKKLFNKFLNSDKQHRFGKRNIYHHFLYRKSKRDLELA